MRKYCICILIGFVIIIYGCSPKIYYTPDCFTLAHNHKIIAIVPSKISLKANKKVDAEAMKEEQKTESLAFQDEIYTVGC